MRLDHGLEKPLALDPEMPSTPESESELAEEYDGACQYSTSTNDTMSYDKKGND
jgi:hypothetical protein